MTEKWVLDFLNRRAKVEQEMLDAAKRIGYSRPIDADQLRAWAERLGVPEDAEFGRAAPEPVACEPSAEAWAAGYKRYRYAQDVEYDVDWRVVKECLRCVLAACATPPPSDARARLTDARLRQMLEDYRDAWSPGARDELFAQYKAEIAATEREGGA